MSTFVLVHGAWHGGWSWSFVRKHLEQHNHLVHTPTMTGLGNRAHLISDNISLDLLVEDIANVLRNEELNEVILVGHSFGGAVISGVAERVPERISKLVYFDAAILQNGESMFGCMHPKLAVERQRLAEETSGGISLPIPTAKELGVVVDEQWAFLKQFLTPHPLSSYDSPITLEGKAGAGFPCTYIVCSNPLFTPLAWARERAKEYRWPIISIDTGHSAMISAPEELAHILMTELSIK